MYLIISRIRVFPLLLTGTLLLATSSPSKYSNSRLLRKLELQWVLAHSFAQQSHDLLPEVQKADFSNTENAWGLHRVVC